MTWCCPKNWHNFFKAVSHKHRQEILDVIAHHHNLNATQINQKIKLSQPTLSHHLKLLSEAEIITATKKGKEVLYSLNQKHIAECCSGFQNKFCKSSP